LFAFLFHQTVLPAVIPYVVQALAWLSSASMNCSIASGAPGVHVALADLLHLPAQISEQAILLSEDRRGPENAQRHGYA
jgi:hypothetical protein